jgi:predicted ATPase
LAEIHRLRGQLQKAAGDGAAAEISFRKAIQDAQRQGAKLWELRATTSLAQLWRDENRGGEARDLLAPVYSWFTEGFDTPDLKHARALLDGLRE